MSTNERSHVISSDDSSDGGKPKGPACVIIEDNKDGLKCAMCLSCVNDPLNYGEMYKIENLVCHYFCLLFSSSLVQNGADDEGIQGFFPKDIQKEIRRGSRLKCSYCRRTGATIGCNVKTCKKTFHLPCGLKRDSMHQYFDQFLSFCSNHRLHQTVDPKAVAAAGEDEDALICPICYENVKNEVSTTTLWAPCCKKRWFHRSCVQRQAKAQGYFFKCPMCNNKKEFNDEMKKYGIYSPEMDAAWEREPNAFQDLLHTHRRCDAILCKCPDGKAFVQNTGSWRLLRCNSCGSQGTHIICGGLKIAAASNSWRCPLCSDVISKANLDKVTSDANQPTSINTSASLSITTVPTNTSQRRPSDCTQVTQAIKRRRENSDVELGGAGVSWQLSSSLSITKVEAKADVPGPSQTASSDDEIVIVDDSESDIEVLDEVTVKEPILFSRTSSRITTSTLQFADKELLTKDGKKIKVHKVTAEGDSVQEEVGNLGVVRISQPVPKLEVFKRNETSLSTSDSKSVPCVKKDLVSHPSTSNDPSLSLAKNVCSTSQADSLSASQGGSTSCQQLVQHSDVHHSSKSFSFSRAEDGAGPSASAVAAPSLVPATAPTSVSIAGAALPMPFATQANSMNFLTTQVPVFFCQMKTADGQDVLQPMIQFPMLSALQGAQPQQRLLQQLQQQQQQQQPPQPPQNNQQRSAEKDRSSPDIVVLD
ncbi:hypothetical protein ONE63_008002 [Megalurothrips usitatus]|uniref:G2/M phase-specific E3 ubiquitin-protein ligase-like n=1 Tax=Megalurothrips usitatus TaxID=439358 RepID=A0AAV7XSZ3_9NEOP|nr:hypothetical protein ONE63_008002 [Megalurothrips usitatus]